METRSLILERSENPTTYFMQLKCIIIERFEQLCDKCPDFLLPMVLESLLGPTLYDLNESEIQSLYQSLDNSSAGIENVDGYHLGMLYLKSCKNEGLTFVVDFHQFSDEQIKDWRNQL